MLTSSVVAFSLLVSTVLTEESQLGRGGFLLREGRTKRTEFFSGRDEEKGTFINNTLLYLRHTQGDEITLIAQIKHCCRQAFDGGKRIQIHREFNSSSTWCSTPLDQCTNCHAQWHWTHVWLFEGRFPCLLSWPTA